MVATAEVQQWSLGCGDGEDPRHCDGRHRGRVVRGRGLADLRHRLDRRAAARELAAPWSGSPCVPSRSQERAS